MNLFHSTTPPSTMAWVLPLAGLFILPCSAAPVITSAPSGTANLYAGGAPIYRVKVTGTEPITYQWKRNGDPVAGNGTATTSALALSNTTVANSGSYAVTVTDPTGSVTSNPFTVNFSNLPPPNLYAAKVLADGPTAYWRLSESSGSVFTDVAGGHNGTMNATRIERGIAGPRGLAPDNATRFKATTDGISASVPYTPNLNSAGPFSVECWVKPDLAANTGKAVLSTQNRNAGRSGYVIYQGTGGNFWDVQLGAGGSFVALNGSTPIVAGRWDHIVLTWDGAEPGVATLYVNGFKQRSVEFVLPFRNNEAQSLEMGSRFGGALPYAGAVDEVAYYNYALSPEQVENHFSITYFAPEITTAPPATVSSLEENDLTLTASVTGFPNTLLWLRDGNPLNAAETNSDGSKKYPQGITGATLMIHGLTDADAGVYVLSISNPLANLDSAGTTVTVAPDKVPPTVTYVTGTPTLNRVRVGFNKPMSADSIVDTNHYTFSGGLITTGVFPTDDPSVINVTTDGMLPGRDYTLNITGVRDSRVSQNLIGPNLTSFKSYVLTQGAIAWDFYRNTPGSSVSGLTNNYQYPDGPWTHRILNKFSTMTLTLNNDLSTHPDFNIINPLNNNKLGELYGARMYGWLTPTQTSNYTFFIRSDDASILSISTDESPENLVQIAAQPGCCNGFTLGGSLSSEPIPLVAGQRYFIEGIYKEGGGGDYLEVAWRASNNGADPATLQPIPGQFLSTYAPASNVALGTINKPVVSGSQVTLSWTGGGILQESANMSQWTDVAGNPSSPYVTTLPPNVTKRFYRLRQ